MCLINTTVVLEVSLLSKTFFIIIDLLVSLWFNLKLFVFTHHRFFSSSICLENILRQNITGDKKMTHGGSKIYFFVLNVKIV